MKPSKLAYLKCLGSHNHCGSCFLPVTNPPAMAIPPLIAGATVRFKKEFNQQGTDNQRLNRRRQLDSLTKSSENRGELREKSMQLSPEEKQAIKEKRRQQGRERRTNRSYPLGQ